mmetsp:Transcript_803/g.1516  ORF Transcript_803/g.1516 Transcript_803/m.1516 type:complete len:314 (+) Transcript_803:87-1028(+)
MYASSEVYFVTTIWLVSSIGMLLFNKQAINAMPQECILIALQMSFTSFVLSTFGRRHLYIGSVRDLRRWLMVVPFFPGMLLTSIMSLKKLPLSLVIACRSLAPIVALSIECLFPEPPVMGATTAASVFVILCGASLVATSLNAELLSGISWAMLNNLFGVADRLLQRLLLSQKEMAVDMSLSACTLLNNLCGILPMMIAALVRDEIAELPMTMQHMTPADIVCLCASCAVGLVICYTGLWAQSLISATSFMMLNNTSKVLVIFVDLSVSKQKILTRTQIFGALVTIAGAALYGMQQVARKDQDAGEFGAEKKM